MPASHLLAPSYLLSSLLVIFFLQGIQFTTDQQRVFDFLYPDGFNTDTIHITAILAGVICLALDFLLCLFLFLL